MEERVPGRQDWRDNCRIATPFHPKHVNGDSRRVLLSLRFELSCKRSEIVMLELWSLSFFFLSSFFKFFS